MKEICKTFTEGIHDEAYKINYASLGEKIEQKINDFCEANPNLREIRRTEPTLSMSNCTISNEFSEEDAGVWIFAIIAVTCTFSEKP